MATVELWLDQVKKAMKNSVFLKNEKFITDYCMISRVIPLEVIKENPALATIYARIILKSLRNIQGNKAYHDFMHENYGASFLYRNYVIGDYDFLGITFECNSKKYLPNNYDAFSNLIEESKIAFMEEPIFDECLIENNKQELIQYIKRSEMVPYKICYKKAFAQLDENHRINFEIIGNIKEVEAINKDSLMRFHNKIKQYPFSFLYQGNNEFNQYELVKGIFKDEFELPVYIDVPIKKNGYIYGEENFDNPHSFLIMLYSIDFEYSLRDNYVLRLLSSIIGGSDSILFDEIREKKGLCYSINSQNYTSENIIIITTQISKNNVDRTIASIDEILSNFDKYYNQSYFDIAKMDLISQLIEIEDSAVASFNNSINILYKRGRVYNFKECIEAIESIKYEEVLELAKTLKKQSTYVVKGK